MAVTAQRRLVTPAVRSFGSGRIVYSIPDLTKIQTASYERFLQYRGGSNEKRRADGLEGVLQEITPLPESGYDGCMSISPYVDEAGLGALSPDHIQTITARHDQALERAGERVLPLQECRVIGLDGLVFRGEGVE
ncbi:MAG: hypothetical protein IH786_11215 [Proteobacteria bacterium]|nr:hypothetical protein [Pseudomonadota bacterium]